MMNEQSTGNHASLSILQNLAKNISQKACVCVGSILKKSKHFLLIRL